MSINKLLLWMSARGQGSWQQFRGAVEEFDISAETTEPDIEMPESTAIASDLPLYQKLRLSFQRLAHAEFRARRCTNGWRITPPTLATVRHGDQWHGFLCGARSSRLLDRLNDVSSSTLLVTEPQEYAPDRISLVSDSAAELASVAEKAGLFFQDDAPPAILAGLPVIDDTRMLVKTKLPPSTGWNVERFSVSGLCWRQATADDALSAHKALFRFRMHHQRFHYLCANGKAFEVPIQVGKFMALRRGRKKVLRYDLNRGHLLVPPICRPPLLIERALILCSGSLPQYDPSEGHIRYADIPVNVARLAAQLLRQEVA